MQKFEECGVMELLLLTCQKTILKLKVCLRRRRSFSRWYWSVLEGKWSERCTKFSPGIEVRQRRRLKTPPLRKFGAAAQELTPKICIVWDSSTPGAENKTLRVEDIWHNKPRQGHTTLKKKKGSRHQDKRSYQTKSVVRMQNRREVTYVP